MNVDFSSRTKVSLRRRNVPLELSGDTFILTLDHCFQPPPRPPFLWLLLASLPHFLLDRRCGDDPNSYVEHDEQVPLYKPYKDLGKHGTVLRGRNNVTEGLMGR